MEASTVLRNGALVQARVLAALMLREIHTINGSSRLGYLWVLIQSAFSIGVFWALRAYMGAHAPHGISMALFLAVGFGVWSIFSGSISRCMTAVAGNRALLTFPQVTELDVMLARVLVLSATQICTTVLIVSVDVMLGSEFRPSSLLAALYVVLISPFCALGMGLMLSSLAVFLPVLDKIVPMALRIFFFLSGVFFSASAFSQDVVDVLLWNPILQLVEMLRMSLYDAYAVDGVNPLYTTAFTIVSLSIGLLLERHVRSRRKDQ